MRQNSFIHFLVLLCCPTSTERFSVDLCSNREWNAILVWTTLCSSGPRNSKLSCRWQPYCEDLWFWNVSWHLYLRLLQSEWNKTPACPMDESREHFVWKIHSGIGCLVFWSRPLGNFHSWKTALLWTFKWRGKCSCGRWTSGLLMGIRIFSVYLKKSMGVKNVEI